MRTERTRSVRWKRGTFGTFQRDRHIRFKVHATRWGSFVANLNRPGRPERDVVGV